MALGQAIKKGKEAAKKAANTPKTESPKDLEVFHINVNSIHPDPNQPRKSFDDEAFKVLVAQIKATEGCKQPIKVRPHPELKGEYMIKFGERRWRSHKELKFNTIPAILEIQEAAEFSDRLEQVIENVGRDDLNRFDEAMAYQNLINIANQEEGREKKFLQKDLAELLGFKAPYLSQIMSILKAPEAVQALSIDGITQNVNVFSCLKKLQKLLEDEEFTQLIQDVRQGNVNDKDLQLYITELQAPAKDDSNHQITEVREEEQLPLSGVNSVSESSETGESTKPKQDFGFYDYKNVYEKALFDLLYTKDIAFEITEQEKDEIADKIETVFTEYESGEGLDDCKGTRYKLATIEKAFFIAYEDVNPTNTLKSLLNIRCIRRDLYTAILGINKDDKESDNKKETNKEKLQPCNFLEMESFEVLDGFVLINAVGSNQPIRISAEDAKQISESL